MTTRERLQEFFIQYPHVTQEALARTAGVSVFTVSKTILGSTSPNETTILKLNAAMQQLAALTAAEAAAGAAGEGE